MADQNSWLCAITLVVNQLKIVIVEQIPTDNERVFGLYLDGVSQGFVRFQSHIIPSIAVGGNNIAIWGGFRIYFCTKDVELKLFDQDDEIHTAYPAGKYWCLVRELSITLFDPSGDGLEITRYNHDEILMDSWWRGSYLTIKDLQDRQLRFQLLEGEHNPMIRAD